MSAKYEYCEKINLYVENKISFEDANRQEATAREILRRLSTRPGLILADEVGMGKTFVSLAVAASVALSDKKKRPVVVMVPSSLKNKWPDDFDVFKERCLPKELKNRIEMASAERAVDFLRLIEPQVKRPAIIFLTHGALHRNLSDPWTKLALVQRALRYRKNIDRLRRALCDCMGDLIRMKTSGYEPSDWEKLLSTDPSEWARIISRNKRLDTNGKINDPVPQAVRDAIEELETRDIEELFLILQRIPKNKTTNYYEKLQKIRRGHGGQDGINDIIKKVWRICARNLKFKLPLLIFDEAHHLKNANTRVASLFYEKEAEEDAGEVSAVLKSAFERMLFLTATPFQLGHHELCSVLMRFGDISWKSCNAPEYRAENYMNMIKDLQHRLDEAQESAILLDRAWGKLDRTCLTINGRTYPEDELNAWWEAARQNSLDDQKFRDVNSRINNAKNKMCEAENALRPWVIRHLKPKKLPFYDVDRRRILPGSSITDGDGVGTISGITVSGPSLLPFLLAARATACNPETRPVFAEGLSSSYEAFKDTRSQAKDKKHNKSVLDEDENPEFNLEVQRREKRLRLVF